MCMEEETIVVIENIINSLRLNPNLIGEYSADDICAVIWSEYDDRKNLITRDEAGLIEEQCLNIEKSVKRSFENLNSHEAIFFLERAVVFLRSLPDRKEVEKKNFDRELRRHRSEKTTVILGDSHVNFFSGNETLTFEPIGNNVNICPQKNDIPFTVVHCGPCLAYNSNRYGSTNGFREKAEWITDHFMNRDARVVLCLGEIDLRVHVLKQAEIQKCDYEIVVDSIIENYMSFMKSLRNSGHEVFCWGPIATQKDNCPVDKYCPRYGCETDRNRATAYFNTKLKEECSGNGITFMSIFEQIIDKDYRTKEEFLSDDCCHLGQSAFEIARAEWDRAGLFKELNTVTLTKEDTISRYPCVIPTIKDDYERAKNAISIFFDLLPINKIVFVGPEKLKTDIEQDLKDGIFEDRDISFVSETELVPFDRVKAAYEKVKPSDPSTTVSSVNWYYQQFLKMAYSLVCHDEYYLCWDSDTLPLRKINMFCDDGRPYLDIKTEFQNSYFVTIQKLFGFSKLISKSFVSEHMLFKCEFMIEMIGEIEATPFKGDAFYEKILSAVGTENLKLGFSEFETYGTWICMRHNADYMLRNWNSFRNTNFFIDRNNLTKADVEWLSLDYDAATFEKYQETEQILTDLFRNDRYRQKLSPRQFYMSILESGALGDYENGYLRIGDELYPI